MLILQNIFRRQLNIFDPESNQIPVTIIGAGMIGSMTALALSKLGIKSMTIYDDDKMEAHNFPNQMYPKSALGEYKVNYLKTMLDDWSYSDVEVIPTKWDDSMDLSGIVISGVDSIPTRAEIWGKCKYNDKVDLFIDGRIGGQQICVYVINPLSYSDVKYYEESLEGTPSSLPCTERGVIDVTFDCAGLITRQVRGFLVNNDIPSRCIVYDADEMYIHHYRR